MKTLYKILLSLYTITFIYVLISQFHVSLIISAILLVPLFFIKPILYKNEYLLYIYLTQLLGSACGFYSLPYYDKAMHFLSGIIFVIVGYIVLKSFIFSKKVLYMMINCVEMSAAFLWEVFEYCGLILFNYDASRHYTTGVHDTMQDMIFSFIAGLIITFIIYKYPTYIESLYKLPPDNPGELSQ